MSLDLSADLSWILAALLLTALLAVVLTAAALRRARRTAAAHTLSLQQELERLRRSSAELERTSYTDALTGVWNYRYLQLSLDREIARSARHPLPDGTDRLALLLLEIEGFDEIRREYGHQRAGAVLRDLAQRLAMEVREADVFGRYGGEEFLILLPDTDADGAEHVAERLRWTVRRHPLALPSVPALSVPALSEDGAAAPVNGLSAAIGISVLPRDGGHATLLLRAADRALAAARTPATESPESSPAEAPEPAPEGDLKIVETSTSQPVYALLAQGCDLTVKARDGA
ncbi:GGDEF domain-containing protein [Streptacidiphilus sp. PAMC 29251]